MPALAPHLEIGVCLFHCTVHMNLLRKMNHPMLIFAAIVVVICASNGEEYTFSFYVWNHPYPVICSQDVLFSFDYCADGGAGILAPFGVSVEASSIRELYIDNSDDSTLYPSFSLQIPSGLQSNAYDLDFLPGSAAEIFLMLNLTRCPDNGQVPIYISRYSPLPSSQSADASYRDDALKFLFTCEPEDVVEAKSFEVFAVYASNLLVNREFAAHHRGHTMTLNKDSRNPVSFLQVRGMTLNADMSKATDVWMTADTSFSYDLALDNGVLLPHRQSPAYWHYVSQNNGVAGVRLYKLKAEATTAENLDGVSADVTYITATELADWTSDGTAYFAADYITTGDLKHAVLVVGMNDGGLLLRVMSEEHGDVPVIGDCAVLGGVTLSAGSWSSGARLQVVWMENTGTFLWLGYTNDNAVYVGECSLGWEASQLTANQVVHTAYPTLWAEMKDRQVVIADSLDGFIYAVYGPLYIGSMNLHTYNFSIALYSYPQFDQLTVTELGLAGDKGFDLGRVPPTFQWGSVVDRQFTVKAITDSSGYSVILDTSIGVVKFVDNFPSHAVLVPDCTGLYGGDAQYTLCGICEGDERSCCSYRGNFSVDTGCECDEGYCGSMCQDTEDSCGVCNGADACVGCNGIPFAVYDKCGICAGNNRSCCHDHGVFDGDNCTCDDDGDEPSYCGLWCEELRDSCGECGGNGTCTDNDDGDDGDSGDGGDGDSGDGDDGDSGGNKSNSKSDDSDDDSSDPLYGVPPAAIGGGAGAIVLGGGVIVAVYLKRRKSSNAPAREQTSHVSTTQNTAQPTELDGFSTTNNTGTV